MIGKKGTMYSPADYGDPWYLLPKKEFEGYKDPTPTMPHLQGDDDVNQKKEWAAAIKGGPAAHANFNYAGLLAEAVLLGNVAIRAGKKLEWEGESMKFKNAPEAEKFLRREYRNGWTL